jgi:hypothetical protein
MRDQYNSGREVKNQITPLAKFIMVGIITTSLGYLALRERGCFNDINMIRQLNSNNYQEKR